MIDAGFSDLDEELWISKLSRKIRRGDTYWSTRDLILVIMMARKLDRDVVLDIKDLWKRDSFGKIDGADLLRRLLDDQIEKRGNE